MCKLIRKIIGVLLAVVFAVCAGFMLHQFNQYEEAEDAHQLAQRLAVKTQTTEPAAPVEDIPEETVPLASVPQPDNAAKAVMALDVAALQAVNADVLGWIQIPETKIDYPLLCADSNDEYLHTAWDGSENYSGSIYLECQNSRDLSDFYSLIYGHNMANGTMFGNLILYGDQGFRDAHPYIYLNVGGAVRRYEIFAAYTADVQSDTYRIGFSSDERKQQAISYYLEKSVISADREITAADQIITLSTCTGTGDYSCRWVVQAVLDATWDVR